MRIYAALRVDPVLGLTQVQMDALIAVLLHQPMCDAVERAAVGSHEHWVFPRANAVFGHTRVGSAEINSGVAWAAIHALGMIGTDAEQVTALLEAEWKAAAISAGYDPDLFGLKWSGAGDRYSAISTAQVWAAENAALLAGTTIDDWTKPTRDPVFVGANYIQVSPTQYNVTALSGSGPGSLREALDTPGEREIHFAIPGTIALTGRIDPPPGFVIDGSDAPAGGICIRNAPSYESVSIYTYKGNGGVFRHIRFRPGFPAGGYNNSCKGLVIGNGSTNILLDHCSFSWGTDGVTGVGAQGVTFQDCIFSEGLAPAGELAKGILVQESAGHVAFINCLFAHLGVRTPKFDTGTDVQFINNVVYNCTSQVVFGGKSYPLFQRADVTGNTWIAGPNSSSYHEIDYWGTRLGGLLMHTVGNVGPHCTVEQVGEIVNPERRPYVAFEVAPITIPDRSPTDAATAYMAVLSEAGATLPKRDVVDARIIQDVINLTGGHITNENEVGGWPDLTI